MKIVKIIGGLGNQMFQYALYLSLKKIYPKEVIKIDTTLFDSYKLHNGFELRKVFGIEAEYATKEEINHLSRYIASYKLQRIVRKLLPRKKTEYIESLDFVFQPEVLCPGDMYYEGYWQNADYFRSAETEVRKAFSFLPVSTSKNQALITELKGSDIPTVSVHVRRGDYLNHKIFGGICDQAYYQRAITTVLATYRVARFYFFSNDIEWCKTNLLPFVKDCPVVFVDWNQGRDSYIDMELMALCRINIIANSSFSWWAAWLNDFPQKKVVAPRIWARTPYENGIQLKSWYLI